LVIIDEIQVGSFAIGAAVVSAFSSFIVDITGILATIAVMATAFAILPKKRRDAMKEFNHKMDALIEELTSSVSSQLERDFEGISIQVTDSLVPLKNFYKIEAQKLQESKKRVQDIRECRILEKRLNQLKIAARLTLDTYLIMSNPSF